MRPPAFWARPPDAPGWQARLLAPVSALAAAATARRVVRAPGFRASVPVICIGNLNLGGSGKTPAAIALALRLAGRGLAVHIVSRGYGGRLPGPVLVDEQAHDARDVGDEPLLLAAFAPTWVARDRAAGVAAAQAAGAQVILLDDGHQNPAVHKDISIVVVDAARGFGNGRVLPAGPLREPVDAGLKRCDVLLSIGDGAAQQAFGRLWGHAVTGPRCSGELVALQTGMSWQDMDVYAFAGIGHPDKFFDTLRRLGARLVGTQTLDDHQPLTSRLMARLQQAAQAANAQLVTTEKDAVRLPDEFRTRVLTLPVRLQIDDWSVVDGALAKLGL